MIMENSDRRPRDWAYKTAFNRKDLPSLQAMVQHIRETHDTNMIEDFNLKCEQKLTTGRGELENGIIIEDVAKIEDLVVNVGLQQCINLILGTSSTRWSHIQLAGGTSGSPPNVSNINVDNGGGGPFALALSTYGWAEARGMKLFFGCIGPQDSPLGTSSIADMGVFNGPSQGPTSTMLNRENFINNPLSRSFIGFTAYNAVFIFSCVIEFCPVA